MKKIFVLSAALIILIGVWGVWSFYEGNQARSSGSAKDNAIEVTIGSIQSIVTAQGTLEPKNYVDVGAQVSGEVIKLHVEIGDLVKAGDLIAEIDPDVYESQVKSSKAQLKILAAQKAQQEALIKQAKRKFERNERLYKDKAVSQETFEDAEIDLDVAKASLMALAAQIEQAQSNLDEDQTNLNYTKIYAPMDGTVVDQSVEEGETINANQTTPTIVQVANLNIMTAKAEVAEADVMKLAQETPMYFTTLGSGDRRWKGAVRQILPTPEEINDVVLYNVLVDVDNTDLSLLPGMTTQMFFVLASAKDVPIIPASALGRRLKDKGTDQGQAYQVHVMTPSGPEVRVVIISLSDRAQAAVASGLEAGEKILPTSKAKSTGERPKRTPQMRL
tara:strand:+ start:17633 stop:18799 length:1167 start_codon:yes stop_codon:yes gene_type:complete